MIRPPTRQPIKKRTHKAMKKRDHAYKHVSDANYSGCPICEGRSGARDCRPHDTARDNVSATCVVRAVQENRVSMLRNSGFATLHRTTGMRKERSFPGDVANGSDRP